MSTGSPGANRLTGRLTGVSRDGRSTAYAYDGLGRQATVSDETRYGPSTTRVAHDGATAVQQSNDIHGTSTLVRDIAGNLAQHVDVAGEVTWDLLDRLGSTVAGVSGGSISELASYDDWGSAVFESGAWSAPEGYSGEQSDPTSGLNAYGARSYDPAAATWTAADTWRGLLGQPKSLSRYAFVESSPVTFIDVGGHRIGDPSAYNTRSPAQAAAMREVDNATNYWVAENRAKTFGYEAPTKPKAVGPTAKNKNAERHEVNFKSYVAPTMQIDDPHGMCPAGEVMVRSPYVSPQCVDKRIIEDSERRMRLGFECSELCRLAWVQFGTVIVDAIPFAPGAFACGTSLPLGGAGCVHLDPEAGGSFLNSFHEWSGTEQALWEEWSRNN